MKKGYKALMLLPCVALLASCGLGTKIGEQEFVDELALRKSNFDDSKFLSLTSKGSATYDFDNKLNVVSYECTYSINDQRTETSSLILNMINWDLKDVRERVDSLTDETLDWKFYKNDDNGAIYVTAFHGETLTIGDDEFNYNFDFEYGWNQQGLLFHSHEYITVPNSQTPFLEDTLVANLDITFTFAE